MIYGRAPFPLTTNALDCAAVSHSAELVRGAYLTF